MSFMSWDESYSVGIHEIDKQHQKLFQLINTLYAAVKETNTNNVLASILKELAEYAVYHFKVEEDYFAEFSYVDGESHKKEHEIFIAKIDSYIEENKTTMLLNPLKVFNFLSYWLFHHIGDCDKKYAPFLQENGIK